MKKVVHDPVRCAACRACEVQCAVAHSRGKELFAALSETPRSLPRVVVTGTPGMNVSIRCAHCEIAPCLLACPVGAIDRHPDTGTVLLRAERCIGCFTCVLVCPFGAVGLSADRRKAEKCDGCIDRVSEGQEPACASACPTRSLTYGEVEDAGRDRRAVAARREDAAARAASIAAAREPSVLEAILRMREEMSRG